MSKLLVVDDEQSICWGLSRLGESMGHEVATAPSAEQALESVDDVRPDVIVLDVVLPDTNGLDLCRQWQETPALKDTPVLLMSGKRSGSEDRLEPEYVLRIFHASSIRVVIL